MLPARRTPSATQRPSLFACTRPHPPRPRKNTAHYNSNTTNTTHDHTHHTTQQKAIEAAEAGVAEVARLLQAPEDLARLPQLAADAESRAAASRAALGAALGSQVEAVRYGLELLERGRRHAAKLKACVDGVGALCEEAADLVENHDRIRALSLAHMNVSGAAVMRWAAGPVALGGKGPWCLPLLQGVAAPATFFQNTFQTRFKSKKNLKYQNGASRPRRARRRRRPARARRRRRGAGGRRAPAGAGVRGALGAAGRGGQRQGGVAAVRQGRGWGEKGRRRRRPKGGCGVVEAAGGNSITHSNLTATPTHPPTQSPRRQTITTHHNNHKQQRDQAARHRRTPGVPRPRRRGGARARGAPVGAPAALPVRARALSGGGSSPGGLAVGRRQRWVWRRLEGGRVAGGGSGAAPFCSLSLTCLAHRARHTDKRDCTAPPLGPPTDRRHRTATTGLPPSRQGARAHRPRAARRRREGRGSAGGGRRPLPRRQGGLRCARWPPLFQRARGRGGGGGAGECLWKCSPFAPAFPFTSETSQHSHDHHPNDTKPRQHQPHNHNTNHPTQQQPSRATTASARSQRWRPP